MIDVHIFEANIGDCLFKQRNAFFDGKEGFLTRIVPNRDDHLIEDLGRSCNNIKMPIGYRIETTRADGRRHSTSAPSLMYSQNSRDTSPYTRLSTRCRRPTRSGRRLCRGISTTICPVAARTDDREISSKTRSQRSALKGGSIKIRS